MNKFAKLNIKATLTMPIFYNNNAYAYNANIEEIMIFKSLINKNIIHKRFEFKLN